MATKLFEVTVIEKLEAGKRKSWMHRFVAIGENEAEAVANAREAYPAWFANAASIEAETGDFNRAMKLRTSMKTNRRT